MRAALSSASCDTQLGFFELCEKESVLKRVDDGKKVVINGQFFLRAGLRASWARASAVLLSQSVRLCSLVSLSLSLLMWSYHAISGVRCFL